MAIIKIGALPMNGEKNLRGYEIPAGQMFTFMYDGMCTFGMKSYNGDRIVFINQRGEAQFVDGYNGDTCMSFRLCVSLTGSTLLMESISRWAE